MVMSKRAEWIREMLVSNAGHPINEDDDLIGRVEVLESMVANQETGVELEQNTQEFIAKSLDMLADLGLRVDEAELSIESMGEITSQVASLYKSVRVLAEFMERCSPFIKGMEDAFSSNEIEGSDNEGVE